MNIKHKNLVIGLSGKRLTDEEKNFLNEANPLGVILFKRNCESYDQLRELTKEVSTILTNPMIMIDYEGGRVNRLRDIEPEAGKLAASSFGDMYETDPSLAKDNVSTYYGDIAHQLKLCGINVNCAPVLDIRHPGASDVIGDRSFSEDIEIVSALGKIAIDAMLTKGVVPVIKHIPGHGASMTDTHTHESIVNKTATELLEYDLVPFIAAKNAPMAMVSHIKYTSIDPDNPASQSSSVLQMIKDAGYNGLIITDDIRMEALEGTIQERAQKSLDAGCDVILYCGHDIDVMTDLIKISKDISVSIPSLIGECNEVVDIDYLCQNPESMLEGYQQVV